MYSLFPAYYPRIERVLHELKALLLDVGKARLLEIGQHVRRHAEYACDLVYLELSRFEELRLLR